MQLVEGAPGAGGFARDPGAKRRLLGRVVEPGEDLDEGPVRIGHAPDHRLEAARRLWRRVLAKDRRDVGTRTLESLDVRLERGVDRVQGRCPRVVEFLDAAERNAELGESAQPDQLDEVLHPVLLVAVVSTAGKREQTDFVVVPDRVDGRPREIREFPCAPRHDILLTDRRPGPPPWYLLNEGTSPASVTNT